MTFYCTKEYKKRDLCLANAMCKKYLKRGVGKKIFNYGIEDTKLEY